MMDKCAVDKLIEERFESLPAKLQEAARYVIDHPTAVALKSMRMLAADIGAPASTMNRLAQSLGFEGWGPFREVYRKWLSEEGGGFAERATKMQKKRAADKTENLIREIVEADQMNLGRMLEPQVLKELKGAREVLLNAERIFVGGMRSLFPAAYYFNYACNMFMQNLTLLSGIAGVFADDLRHAGPKDVLVVFTYEPYARDIMTAVEYAREKGVTVVAITDSIVSPVAKHATVTLVLPNSTPSFFPSVVPALAAAQVLAAFLLADGGKAGLAEIEKSEDQLRRFAVYMRDRIYLQDKS